MEEHFKADKKMRGCTSNLGSPYSKKCVHCGYSVGPLRFRNEMLWIILATVGN